MTRCIQIGNLPDSVDSLDHQRLFEAHGAVRSAKIARRVETGRSTGVGFVEMESEAGGTAAIAAMNGRTDCGRILAVCWSKPGSTQGARHEEMFGPMNMADAIAPPQAKPERRGLP